MLEGRALRQILAPWHQATITANLVVMCESIITLTTDFGAGSPYVAQMKGAILSINRQARIVDLTHAIEPQNVLQAAWVLRDVTIQFPARTIHVVVVDPGVGTARRIVCAQWDEQLFIAPDNGCLTGLANAREPSTIRELAEPQFWRPNVSSTFHGRDIMAPVAAHLSLGLNPEALGPRCASLVQLELPEAHTLSGKIEGEVVSIDSFGNLVTNITSEMLADTPRDETTVVRCDEHETLGIYQAYADQPEMTLIALIGSSGYLELAIVNDSAKIMLGVATGEKVTVSW